MKQDLLIRYWQLPEELFVSLKDNFHKKFCSTILNKVNYKFKNCFYKILDCPKWHAQRLFNQDIRFTIKEFEILRKFVQISTEEVERNLETLGNHEDGTIIKNPKLPFHLKDLVYVASHLMFDGSFRFDKGGYFYAYEPSLVEYHKERLSRFGDVPINFLERENQLYFSYTLGYIAAKILDINNFNSTRCFLSEKLKCLLKKNKILANEIIKALIIDEGYIGDKIEAELANEKLVHDLYESIKQHYFLTKITSRTRDIYFKSHPKWGHTTSVWKLGFGANSFQDLFLSLSPLPINYKQQSLEFLHLRQSRNYNQLKKNELKKLIVNSLFIRPKTIDELAKEFLVKQTTIRAHLKGHPTYTSSLIECDIVSKVGEKIYRKGGYAKADLFGIEDMNKAKEFINS